jgi:MFS family permease
MALKDKKFYPWLVVALLTVVSLLNYLDRQMLATMRPYMMEDIESLRDITNFGRLMAIFLWVYAFMSPVSGVIADKFNRKWLIIVSLFVWSGVTLCMGYVYDIHTLYVLRGVMGISEAFYIPAALSMVADYHQGKTRSIAIGALTSGIYLGQAIGGFGATLSAHTSWQFTFHIFGLVGIAYAVILMALLHEKKTYSPASVQGMSRSNQLRGLLMLFNHIVFWVMLFYFAALNLPGWVTKNWLPTMISENLDMNMAVVGPMWTTTLAVSSFVGGFFG